MASDIVTEPNATATHLPRTNMKIKSERLKTFTNWNVGFLDVKKLIENGFYYTNIDDMVECAFCGVQISSWEEGDVPEEKHKMLSPDCPRVRGLAPDDAPPSCKGIPCKISPPVFPSYATYDSRIKTFDNWPIPHIQAPEKLADAGFYYTARNDEVLCFRCGGGIKKWEIDDDPWVEHSRWFSTCGFIIIRKGKPYVNEILAKYGNELAGEAQQEQQEQEQEEQQEQQQEEQQEQQQEQQQEEQQEEQQEQQQEEQQEQQQEEQQEQQQEEQQEQQQEEQQEEQQEQQQEEQQEQQQEQQEEEQQKQLENTTTAEQKEDKETEPQDNTNFAEPIAPEKEDKASKIRCYGVNDAKPLCRICYVRVCQILFLPCSHCVSCPECAASLSTCAACDTPFDAIVRVSFIKT